VSAAAAAAFFLHHHSTLSCSSFIIFIFLRFSAYPIFNLFALLGEHTIRQRWLLAIQLALISSDLNLMMADYERKS
jgi:hypothetical protein